MSDAETIASWLRAKIPGDDRRTMHIRAGISAALTGTGSESMRELTVHAICGRLDKDWAWTDKEKRKAVIMAEAERRLAAGECDNTKRTVEYISDFAEANRIALEKIRSLT